MDLTSIITALSSLNVAKDAAQAALAVRDFNAASSAIARITDELIKAQQGLLAQNAVMAELQLELAKKRDELAELKKAADERARYSLVELSEGVFVYRLNQGQEGGQISGPNGPEPIHHLCQTCFDQGIKSVLQQATRLGLVTIDCNKCGKHFATGEKRPMPDLSFRADF